MTTVTEVYEDLAIMIDARGQYPALPVTKAGGRRGPRRPRAGALPPGASLSLLLLKLGPRRGFSLGPQDPRRPKRGLLQRVHIISMYSVWTVTVAAKPAAK